MKMFAAMCICASLFAASTASSQTTIAVGHGLSPKSHFGLGMTRFGEVLEEKSGGKYVVEQHFGGSIGNEREMIESVQLGSLDMALVGTGTLPNFVPETQVFDLPFLFQDYDHAEATLDGEIGEELLATVDKAGFKALAWSETGFRNVTNSKHPIRTPEDLTGLKIRTMENPVHLSIFQSLGAAPTPMSWPEVFPALQQKMIDGQENPANVILITNLFEVQEYLTMTGHVYAPAIILMSQALWEGLSPEEQEWFTEAASEAVKITRQVGREQEAAAVSALREKGMKVETEFDKSQFREATSDVYDAYASKFGNDLIERIRGLQ